MVQSAQCFSWHNGIVSSAQTNFRARDTLEYSCGFTSARYKPGALKTVLNMLNYCLFCLDDSVSQSLNDSVLIADFGTAKNQSEFESPVMNCPITQ